MSGKNALFRESFFGNVGKVEALLADGKISISDENDDGENALHCACSNENIDIILFLLQRGCNPNHRNCHGETPLHYATVNGLKAVCRILTHYGADFNIRTASSFRPLELARSEDLAKCYQRMETATVLRYDDFYHLFFVHECLLAVALSEAVDGADTVERKDKDVFSKKLVKFFESVGQCGQLIQRLIHSEVSRTVQEQTLFRTDSMATKVMANYAKLLCINYLEKTIGELIRQTVGDPSGYEVDPAKAGSEQAAQANVKKLQNTCKAFLDNILRSQADLPASVHTICHSLFALVGEKFPDSRLQAVGGFIFLRLINAAVSNPNMYGLVPKPEVELTPDQRRPLILIAKVMQNLANNIEFGAKEPYMTALNAFVAENQRPMNDWLSTFATPPQVATEVRHLEFSRDDITSADYIFLHTLIVRVLPRTLEYIARPDPVDPAVVERAAKICAAFHLQPAVRPVESLDSAPYRAFATSKSCREWKPHYHLNKHCVHCDRDYAAHGVPAPDFDGVKLMRGSEGLQNIPLIDSLMEFLEQSRLPPPEQWKSYF